MEIIMAFIGNMAVAQSGGPTSAINSTLCGVIEAAMDAGVKIYGAENGINGVINNKMTLLNDIFADELNRELLKTTPAAFLGSCRYKLPETAEKNEIYENIFRHFERLDIKYFIYIGGNDSMDTVAKLSDYAARFDKDLTVVGVPKTVDNDLAGTDHTPGFGSAAKFVAATVKCIARDSAVYAEKSITIVEIMGRNAGWLTAASALARCESSKAPHLIYLPERPVSKEKIIADVAACDERNMIIAISEGIRDENGKYYCESAASSHDIFGHAQLAGSAGVVAKILKEHFHYKTRGIELNIPQRCGAFCASLTDLDESAKIGAAGVRAALEKRGGIMLGFLRNGDYSVKIVENPVSEIANVERVVPDSYISESGCDVTEEYMRYARPLIIGEPTLHFEDGLPKHIALHSFKTKNGE